MQPSSTVPSAFRMVTFTGPDRPASAALCMTWSPRCTSTRALPTKRLGEQLRGGDDRCHRRRLIVLTKYKSSGTRCRSGGRSRDWDSLLPPRDVRVRLAEDPSNGSMRRIVPTHPQLDQLPRHLGRGQGAAAASMPQATHRHAATTRASTARGISKRCAKPTPPTGSCQVAADPVTANSLLSRAESRYVG